MTQASAEYSALLTGITLFLYPHLHSDLSSLAPSVLAVSLLRCIPTECSTLPKTKAPFGGSTTFQDLLLPPATALSTNGSLARTLGQPGTIRATYGESHSVESRAGHNLPFDEIVYMICPRSCSKIRPQALREYYWSRWQLSLQAFPIYKEAPPICI